ncbi:hypothetical protein E2C01_088566 [Portunus trituberculatus]|uniref:Uncharacterized protein n=1 Tax=Portunus trituberculatus TaxID=210409 RepID=A0A5B7J9M3_PORTR|nr:hypothetical protein [Portunus trituberculatus]
MISSHSNTGDLQWVYRPSRKGVNLNMTDTARLLTFRCVCTVKESQNCTVFAISDNCLDSHPSPAWLSLHHIPGIIKE